MNSNGMDLCKYAGNIQKGLDLTCTSHYYARTCEIRSKLTTYTAQEYTNNRELDYLKERVQK